MAGQRRAAWAVAATAMAVVMAAPAPAAAVEPKLDPSGTGIDEAGPRARYEASVGQPPRTFMPTGRLGHEWSGEPSYIAGSAVYSRGELIASDTPFDDTGADTFPDTEAGATWALASTRGTCGNTAAYRHGELAYPDEPAYGRNAADLVEVRLAADGSWYYALFVLETLIEARTTVVGLGIDADRDPGTGTPGWPGFEHVLEIYGVGTGGVAATLDGQPVEASVDVAENTFEARFPISIVPGGTWSVAAAAGTWSGDAWAAVADLAFVADEPVTGTLNCWQDLRQSQLIAAGTPPGYEVDTARLRARASDRAALRRGPMVRLYAPSIRLGEGTIGQPKYDQQSSANVYRGTLQPYAIYVPDAYDPAADNPLVLLLHCLNCNHLTYQLSGWPGLRDLGETDGAIVVTPLAYGEGGHYEEEAEWDVFDVLADVRARYRIDPDRITLAGMSMGALGQFRLGSLYPDLWARRLGIGVYTTPFCVTPSPQHGQCAVAPFNYFTLLGNARNTSVGILNGTLDALTPVTGAREIADRLDALDLAHRYWELPLRQHEAALAGEAADLTAPWLAGARRETRPARITYAFERVIDNPAWGLRYDRAWWLRDLRIAAGAARGEIDATSGRGNVWTTESVDGSGTSRAGDYTIRGLDPVAIPASGRNELSLTLRAVSEATVLPAEAGLSLAEDLRMTVETDGPVAITVAGHDEVLRFDAGTHAVTLSAAPGVSEGAPRDELPATGGGVPLPALLVAAALAAARIIGTSRRR